MKTTKYMITAFAVFASILMLMTPTMARPVQEKTTMDVVQTAEQQVTSDELNEFLASFKVDRETAKLIEQVSNDAKLCRLIESTIDYDELNTFLEAGYTLETYNNGYGGGAGSCDIAWKGFAHNIYGDILVDGEWISPDDPSYNFWINFQNYMQGSGLSTGDILIIIGIIMYVGAFVVTGLYGLLINMGFDLNDQAWIFLISFLGVFGPILWDVGSDLNDKNQP